jgi:leucyl aminopeptidase
MFEVRIAVAPQQAETVMDTGGPAQMRAEGGRIARAMQGTSLTLDASGLAGARLTAFVEGLVLGGDRFSLASTPREPRVLELAHVADAAAVEAGRRNARAGTWARELANMPAATKTPAWLAGRARAELTPLGVHVIERDEHWLAEQRFGGVLAVGGGSVSPPRLIHASWRPRGAVAGRHIVLVGKGITYDSGGLNLKPGASMRSMQTDMSGGAAVLAALRVVAELRLPVRVSALVPSAENSFSGAAYRPGDVVRHYGGRTSEIANTDAEGRLVLADALGYAAATLKPSVLVDIATLTGAMKVALGLRVGGLFATDDRLAHDLLAAGESCGEPLWRMPLASDYAGTLHSDIADANNAPGRPGAITAALFLRPFAADVPWAHLDVAGPARAGEDDGVLARGATGFGARLLARWVEGVAAAR